MVNGKISGSCMTGYDGHRGWIYYLAVKPEYQMQGNAKMLVRHAEKSLLDAGCPKINVMVRKTSIQVVNFYTAMGYSDDPVIVLSRRLKTEDPGE